jgi:hypothetical protein
MRQEYTPKRFTAGSERLIHTINVILEDYQDQGFCLTVRQLYYQLVAKDLIPNQEREYKRIIRLCNDARMAGLLDWDALEDRTRFFRAKQRWKSGSEILKAAAESYHEDLWKNQGRRVFVIIEKDALVGILENVCHGLDVPILAARGYPSVTVLREFAEKQIIPAMDEEQEVIVLHLGDHDPSGIDMTRDIRDRLNIFTADSNGGDFSVHRIALTMDQIRELKPPENPAKETDIRFAGYVSRYGRSSWELDALPPTYLEALVRDHVRAKISPEVWKEAAGRVDDTKGRLGKLADKFTKKRT